MVVFHHVFKLFPELFEPSRLRWPLLYDVLAAISDLNKTAVLLFFVISGFVIALAVQRYDLSTSHDIKRYASNRAARILPLYWGSLAFSAAIAFYVGMNDASFSLRDLVGNVLFLQTSSDSKGSWFVPFALNGPYWSLSYEVFYYLLCPLLILMLGGISKIARHGPLIVALSACASIAGIALSQVAASPFTAFLTLAAVWVCGFAIGISNTPSSRRNVLASMVGVVFCLFFLERAMAHMALRSQTLQFLLEGVTVATLYGAIFWFGDRIPGGPALSRLLSGWLASIGMGSYALYLLHYPMLILLRSCARVGEPMPPRIVIGMVTILALGILWICPWLETTSLKLGRRLFAMKPVTALSGPRQTPSGEPH